MSPVADTSLFQLIHLPETIEKLVSSEQGRRRHHHRRRHHQQQHRKEEKGGMGAVPVDILETTKGYTFFLDVPGLSKSDIQVTVEDESVLVIKGSGKRKREERPEEEGEEKEGGKVQVPAAGVVTGFLRKFRLPEDSNVVDISARYENGELKVTIGKRPPPEDPKPKTVEVAIA